MRSLDTFRGWLRNAVSKYVCQYEKAYMLIINVNYLEITSGNIIVVEPQQHRLSW